MAPHAVLGPVDPQLGDLPAASLLKVVESKDHKDVEDRTLILADVARKAVDQVRGAVEELLEGRMPPERAREVARLMSTGTWTHDYPITFAQARELGLPVSDRIPEAVLELMALYPQPTQAASGVEYLPVPRGGQGRPRGRP